MYTNIHPSCITTHSHENERIEPLEYSLYRNNITEPVPLEDQRKDLWASRHQYLFISSAERDRSTNPTTAAFTINLPQRYENIASIQLLGGTVPALDNIDADPYLLLKVPEIENISTNSVRATAILQLAPHVSAGFYNVDKSCCDSSTVTFVQPKRSLDRLSIRITHPDGTTVNFGTENANDPIDYTIQTTLIFRITTLERSRDQIQRDPFKNPNF